MTESRAYRTMSSSTCFKVSEGGNYTLLVYDIEEDETDATTETSALKPAISRMIAVIGSSTLIFLSPLP